MPENVLYCFSTKVYTTREGSSTDRNVKDLSLVNVYIV